ncbi:MAG: septum site-determining protein MinC [Lachnospiraceae bacterium]|nr:septum site-determining protein MinC [bacterium]MDY5517795.1 septum site-determining protein MinC [Lachnospiraceae bacterium]
MNSQPVVIKSSKNGINLILDDKLPFTELLEEIKKKFIDSEKFFKNAHIAISFEGRSLSQNEQFEVIETIQQNTSITVICILDHDDLMDEVMQRRIGAYEESHSPQTGQFYKGTLRSGQQLESQTSMIVLGDVNPGAKVIAKGNIVILGALKGIAYAGADGDDRCFVAALEMDPVQIKIGDHIGRSADKKEVAKGFRRKAKAEAPVPQIATVYENQILIEPISSGLLKNIL